MNLTLKQARVINGKTQLELANALGVHEQTYRNIEKNPEKTTVEQTLIISSYLGIPYDVIFFGVDSSLTTVKESEKQLA